MTEKDDIEGCREDAAAFGIAMTKALEGIRAYRQTYGKVSAPFKAAMRITMPAVRQMRDELDKLLAAMIRG